MNVKDSGSNYSFYNGSPKASVSRSAFDLSHINTLTAKLGVRYPVWSQHTLMNEDYNYSVEAVARVVNPPVVPLMSKQRILFHTWWLSYHQLWKEAQLFFDKGKNKVQYGVSDSLTIPTIKLTSWKRNTLADFLGFNCASPFEKKDGKTMTVSALKFMAYIRIWRDCYLNQRIYSTWLQAQSVDGSLSDEKRETYKVLYEFLFPTDDSDFRIGSEQWKKVVANADALEYLTSLKFADFADDYFTRSQLSPMYVDDDDIPSIGLTTNGSIQNIVFSDKANKEYNFNSSASTYYYDTVNKGSDSDTLGLYMHAIGRKKNIDGHGFDYASVIQDVGINEGRLVGQENSILGGDGNFKYKSSRFVDALNNTVSADLSSNLVVSGITIDAIRRCESATLILEKMAKTDGSYAQYAKAFFGERPKSAYDFRPTYVGGSYQSVLYSQVLNTTSDNQGKVTGIGVSSGSGNIGRFHSDDYGLFLTIMTILPDTYYCQGLQREDTYEVAEDFYLPERAQLGMQGVLEKELYNQDDSKAEDNEKLFGYQNIYDELRYRANEVHGDVADVSAGANSVGASFSPYIQTRFFTSAPTLTPSFLTTEDNINNSWLSAKDEPPFIVQIANKVQAVRPVPYRAKPATFGM